MYQLHPKNPNLCTVGEIIKGVRITENSHTLGGMAHVKGGFILFVVNAKKGDFCDVQVFRTMPTYAIAKKII